MLTVAKVFRAGRVSGKNLAAYRCGIRCSSQDVGSGVPYKTLQVRNPSKHVMHTLNFTKIETIMKLSSTIVTSAKSLVPVFFTV